MNEAHEDGFHWAKAGNLGKASRVSGLVVGEVDGDDVGRLGSNLVAGGVEGDDDI